MYKILIMICLIHMFQQTEVALSQETESADSKKFYSFTLDGNIPEALKLASSDGVSLKQDVRDEFLKRFGGDKDQSEFLLQKNSPVSDLLVIYRDYWRRAFFGGDTGGSDLKLGLTRFFNTKYAAGLRSDSTLNDDELDLFVKRYVNENGMHTTGFGMTGKFYDLLIWKNQSDTTYHFSLNGKDISPKVVFMTDFVTLGWEEYATLGKYYPGGWATKEAIFCVKDAYDLGSENFLVSYLAHEGQHFEDYKLFPELSSTDLEYRAKLVELAMASRTLYRTISFFISNADSSSTNPHTAANYFVIRDLSRALFRRDFISEAEQWEGVPENIINKESALLLESNTLELLSIGREVKNYIRP